jgi:hypothetical protein
MFSRLIEWPPWIMPTDLDGPSERKRKAAQALAQTNIALLVFVLVIFALIFFLIFY